MADAPTTAPNLPWWLAEGWEECSLCHERYAYEIEVRCTRCDGPLCPHCAVELRVERSLVVCCPEGDEADTTAGEETG